MTASDPNKRGQSAIFPNDRENGDSPHVNVGLLTVRNEADVLAESLMHHTLWFSNIVAIAGDDASAEALSACPAVKCLFRDEELLGAYGARSRARSAGPAGDRAPEAEGGPPPPRFCDACRQPALDWIAREYGTLHTWVTLLHADEFWWDPPNRMAREAEAAGASYVLWGEYRFFLHTSDRGRLDASLPVVERVRWCAGPFFEVRQFRLREHQRYLPGRDHQVLPTGLPGRRWAHVPRYRHYPYRGEAQCEAAYIDKVARRYWQPDHAWLGARADPYVDALPPPANSPLAAWDNTFRQDGDLPDPAGFLPEGWGG